LIAETQSWELKYKLYPFFSHFTEQSKCIVNS
jgi:hypothetical protein